MSNKIEIKPTVEMWKYFNGNITALLVVSSISDKLAGFHISYSAQELLKDLKLLTKKGNINSSGKELVAIYLHYKFHDNGREAVVVVNPLNEQIRVKTSIVRGYYE